MAHRYRCSNRRCKGALIMDEKKKEVLSITPHMKKESQTSNMVKVLTERQNNNQYPVEIRNEHNSDEENEVRWYTALQLTL